MVRRYNVRRYVGRVKRNAERRIRAGSTTVGSGVQQTAYTFTASQAGVVKSIKLDVGVVASSGGEDVGNLAYALVLVREGYNVNNMTYPALTDDLYNPTNDVLISGVLSGGTIEDHKSNKIGRKMKAGDRIALIFYNVAAYNMAGFFELSFSYMT